MSSRRWSVINGWSARRCLNFFISRPNTTRLFTARFRLITKRFDDFRSGGLLVPKQRDARTYCSRLAVPRRSWRYDRHGDTAPWLQSCLAHKRLFVLWSNALAALRFLLQAF